MKKRDEGIQAVGCKSNIDRWIAFEYFTFPVICY